MKGIPHSHQRAAFRSTTNTFRKIKTKQEKKKEEEKKQQQKKVNQNHQDLMYFPR